MFSASACLALFYTYCCNSGIWGAKQHWVFVRVCFAGEVGNDTSCWVVSNICELVLPSFQVLQGPCPLLLLRMLSFYSSKNYTVQCTASVSILLPPDRRQRNPRWWICTIEGGDALEQMKFNGCEIQLSHIKSPVLEQSFFQCSAVLLQSRAWTSVAGN